MPAFGSPQVVWHTASEPATLFEHCALSVSDDGAGLPAAFDPAATQGMGMKIIAALVRQIHGELNFAKGDHDQGTRFSVTFNPEA